MEFKQKVKDLENHQTEIELEIPYAEIEKEFAKKTAKYSKLVQLPGFRKGKVPKSIVVNRFSASLKSETLESILGNAVKEINQDKTIDIYGDVQLKKDSKIDYPEQKPLVVHLVASKKPDCEIKKLHGLDFEEQNLSVKEEHYQKLKDRILETNGTLEDSLEENFKIKDIINADVEFEKELEKFNLKNHSFYFTKESEGAIPDYLNYFYSALLPLKKQEEKEVLIDFPETTKIEELKNKKAKVKVKIHSIKRLKKAEINEDFLKKVNATSEEDFDKNLKDHLTSLAKEKVKELKENSILNAIKKNTEFKIPEIFYDNYLAMTWNEQRNTYKQLNLPEEPPAEWKARAREDIQKKIEGQLIINKIKEKQEINVGEEEMQSEIKKLAGKSKKDEKEFRREIIKSGDYTKIKDNLIIDKVFNYLYLKNNLIKKGDFPVESLINN